MLFPESFQIYTLIAFYRYEIVIALFVVSDEEILGVGLGVRELESPGLLHVVHRLVLRCDVPKAAFFK